MESAALSTPWDNLDLWGQCIDCPEAPDLAMRSTERLLTSMARSDLIIHEMDSSTQRDVLTDDELISKQLCHGSRAQGCL
jgi:hypothetical protein